MTESTTEKPDKYFLGEIVVTHKKTWFGWLAFTHVLTTHLVVAKDWAEAKIKYDEYAANYMAGGKYSKYRYETFVISAI